MELLFEFSFYAGILLTLVGIIWLLAAAVRGKFQKMAIPIGLVGMGLVCVIGPGILSRAMEVDLGPRETMVDGERHITLTGWDRGHYDFLREKKDTVVLQMGNADVHDATLDVLDGMTLLRELDLNDTVVTDAGLAKLARLGALERLRLRGTRISDEGFREHLFDLERLQQIDLRNTDVSEATVEAWLASAENRRAFR